MPSGWLGSTAYRLRSMHSIREDPTPCEEASLPNPSRHGLIVSSRELPLAITLDEIKWIAHLSRLELKPEELIAASTQLSSILNYINQLQEVNTDNVEPLAHALDVSNVFREDVLRESINVNEALANAPDRQGNFYGVPAILE